MVTFARATEKVTGFLALPRDTRRHRAIIIIHEWWDLNEWVKEQAEKLAANGYVTLAVDLYQGRVTTDRSEARKLKHGLRQERAIGDLKAAFDYLADRPDVDTKHIGSLGWSMGGGLAVQLAIHEPRLAARVVNYEPAAHEYPGDSENKCPCAGHLRCSRSGDPCGQGSSVRSLYERCRKASRY
jgi:carboxymethylenebutenolidase